MRTKFLLSIASIFIFSSVITACLDSEETIAYSSDATITAFGLDTIHGRHYQFTIDQLNRIIYNRDSMPVGADTIVDKIRIDTLYVSGWISSGEPKDTIINTTDSLDLSAAVNSEGMTMVAHAPDGTVRNYRLKINIHLQDPDSLVWVEKESFELPAGITPLRSVILNGHLLVFASNKQVFETNVEDADFGWTEAAITGLPDDADPKSAITFANQLYITTESHEVYTSADGLNWTKAETLGSQVIALVAEVNGKLSGIVEINGKNYFDTTDGITWDNAQNADAESLLKEVETGFPIENIYAATTTTANLMSRTIVVGATASLTEYTTPWFTLDGKEWVDLSTDSDKGLPPFAHPAIFYYGNKLYAVGNGLEDIYTSGNAIAWFATQKKFLIDSKMKGADNYCLTIDSTEGHQYIWMITGGEETPVKVWRGRLNKLGFIIQ